MTGPLYEIRDYHYRHDRMGEYREWATEGSETLRKRFDLVGFWVDVGVPARISGSDPMDHGSANVTWIIRWNDMAQRDAAWDALWQDPTWKACWDRHPGFDDYLHMSVRFLGEA